jgi:hypothetical protein
MDFLSDYGGSNQHVSYNCNGRSSSFGTVPITAPKFQVFEDLHNQRRTEDQKREEANMKKLDALAKQMAANPQYKKWKRLQSIKEREMEQNSENEHLSMQH